MLIILKYCQSVGFTAVVFIIHGVENMRHMLLDWIVVRSCPQFQSKWCSVSSIQVLRLEFMKYHNSGKIGSSSSFLQHNQFKDIFNMINLKSFEKFCLRNFIFIAKLLEAWYTWWPERPDISWIVSKLSQYLDRPSYNKNAIRRDYTVGCYLGQIKSWELLQMCNKPNSESGQYQLHRIKQIVFLWPYLGLQFSKSSKKYSVIQD